MVSSTDVSFFKGEMSVETILTLRSLGCGRSQLFEPLLVEGIALLFGVLLPDPGPCHRRQPHNNVE